MKKLLSAMALAAMLSACVKTHDVPSLHEQMEGSWQISSYTEEHYDIFHNLSSKREVFCNSSATMNFTGFERLYVNFDTAFPAVWTYKIINGKVLDIEDRKWSVAKLDAGSFELSLAQRDSSIKQREVVYYRLARP